MSNIIVLINLKGDVGKTTSAANIGTDLNILGFRVLLIDLDSQPTNAISTTKNSYIASNYLTLSHKIVTTAQFLSEVVGEFVESVEARLVSKAELSLPLQTILLFPKFVLFSKYFAKNETTCFVFRRYYTELADNIKAALPSIEFLQNELQNFEREYKTNKFK